MQLQSPSSSPSMQSDYRLRLRSSSLLDQPRNIKLSKRPLDSIVTNEGPSKRSYVASSSKQPSESRVFPAVDSFVQRLANDSIGSKQIDNLSSSDELISILSEDFNNIATVLESYLSCPNHLQQIRSTRRYTASYPFTFIHILLLPLLLELTYEQFNPSITNNTYSKFCQFFQHAIQPSNFESTDHSIRLFIEGLQHGAVPKGKAPGSIFSNHVGVIVKWTMIFLWQGRRLIHGTSIDPWGDKNITETEIRSISMIIVPKPL